ncbi:CBS domain-containing protein [Guyparkeria hydrothermalis]|uniref:CBS domain-containing protein n=1 Tax=Guyparkeria hydrothermalis TaxID=923 RepID=UPI0020210F4A|nr:CBS domain-containing protein [Guyparkeria hydrothermalis]MCL7743352.1 CBS domain-containing protein [Guyparkeria hydrothermalis]
MKIADWLEQHPVNGVTVERDASLEEAAEALLAEPECRDIYVTDAEGRVVGHLGFRRLAGVLLSAHRPTHSRRQMLERVARGPVHEFMDRRFIAARLDENVHQVLHPHMERRVEDIPVLDADGRLVGVIRLVDLVRAAIEPSDQSIG